MEEEEGVHDINMLGLLLPRAASGLSELPVSAGKRKRFKLHVQLSRRKDNNVCSYTMAASLVNIYDLRHRSGF